MSGNILPWKSSASTLCVGLLTDGWTLDQVDLANPDCSRSFRTEVVFTEPFDSAPVVHCSLSGFDMDQRDSARISTIISNVTTTGFVLDIVTWRDTRVYGVEISWLAIGS